VITNKEIKERFKRLDMKSSKRLSALSDQIDKEIDARRAKNKSFYSVAYVRESKRHNHEMIRRIRSAGKKWSKQFVEALTCKMSK
jgi:predicted transcriptional regulator of viral defense system